MLAHLSISAAHLHVVGTDRTVVVIGDAIRAADRLQDPWAAYKRVSFFRNRGGVLAAIHLR